MFEFWGFFDGASQLPVLRFGDDPQMQTRTSLIPLGSLPIIYCMWHINFYKSAFNQRVRLKKGRQIEKKGCKKH